MSARVLVIGASGALGAQICAALDAQGLAVVRGVRSSPRDGDALVDLGDPSSMERAITDVDLVVVAAPHTDAWVQHVSARRGVPCLDVSPHSELRENVQRVLGDGGSPSVVMCGFYPGLSGLLAAQVASELDEVAEIAVGLLQSTNAQVGPAGVRDMLESVARPVSVSDGVVPGFRRRRRMRFAGRPAVVRLVSYDESAVLGERFPTAEVSYFTAWASPVFTGAVAALQRSGILPRLVSSGVALRPAHNPRRSQVVSLRAEAFGVIDGRPVARALEVEADSDYGATALMVAALAQRVLDRSATLVGVLTPVDVIGLSDLAPWFHSRQLRLSAEQRP